MFIGSTDTALRIADSVLKERHKDAARARLVRETLSEVSPSEHRLPRITIRLPKFDLVARLGAGRARTA